MSPTIYWFKIGYRKNDFFHQFFLKLENLILNKFYQFYFSIILFFNPTKILVFYTEMLQNKRSWSQTKKEYLRVLIPLFHDAEL